MVRERVDVMITRALVAIDRDLGDEARDPSSGGALKYMVGKRLLRRKQYDEAYSYFVKAEEWPADAKGPDHEQVTAAIVLQALCQARIGNQLSACREYRRALERIIETGHAGHPLAKRIADWLALACT